MPALSSCQAPKRARVSVSARALRDRGWLRSPTPLQEGMSCDASSLLNMFCYGRCTPVYFGNVYGCELAFDCEEDQLRDAIVRALKTAPRFTQLDAERGTAGHWQRRTQRAIPIAEAYVGGRCPVAISEAPEQPARRPI